jgi:protein gp37
MGDLFHESVPYEWIDKVFAVMALCPQHTFQVLTKRSERLRELSPLLNWSDNIWMGVTVEDNNHVERVDNLRLVPAVVRFLSMEPLLGPVGDLDLAKIDWVIVGGESGPGARPMQEEWVIDIKDTCQVADVPFFFKQWGGVNKKKAGRLLLGKTWDAYPKVKQSPVCLQT